MQCHRDGQGRGAQGREEPADEADPQRPLQTAEHELRGHLKLRGEKGTDLFILLSRSALLPIFDPPSNDRLYCANESFGSCQLPPLQRFADQLPLVYGYRTPHEFPVARCPFIVGNP